MIEMELREIQLSRESTPHIVVLEEKDGERRFPIFIGGVEAEAADLAVRGKRAARPMTHDLVLNVIEALGGTLVGVMVDALENEVFHGKLLVRNEEGKHVKVDSRPSDAIVLAAKEKVPIYVAEEVLDQVLRGEDQEQDQDE
jgi:bifunctional DNase/RNase